MSSSRRSRDRSRQPSIASKIRRGTRVVEANALRIHPPALDGDKSATIESSVIYGV